MAKKTTQKKVSSPARKAGTAAAVPKPARSAASAVTKKPARAAAGPAPTNGTGRGKPPAGVAKGVPPRQDDPAAAPAASKKPGYYEALAMYESGVRALQRHDFEGAAGQFRTIIERYPEERELQERSQLYLRVCERETARRPPVPQTPQERVYAATVALNAGDAAAALDHLKRALTDAPESDHAHYIMSVAQASKGEPARALEHLRRAISLNPENRSLARQDPDLESLRHLQEFRALVEAAPAPARTRPRKKR